MKKVDVIEGDPQPICWGDPLPDPLNVNDKSTFYFIYFIATGIRS